MILSGRLFFLENSKVRRPIYDTCCTNSIMVISHAEQQNSSRASKNNSAQFLDRSVISRLVMCVASLGVGFEVTPVSWMLNLGVFSSRLHGLLFVSKNSLSLINVPRNFFHAKLAAADLLSVDFVEQPTTGLAPRTDFCTLCQPFPKSVSLCWYSSSRKAMQCAFLLKV